MTDPGGGPKPSPSDLARVGLCIACAHARAVVSAKGSTFWLCKLSATDPRFRKYPPLPVRACPGYQRGDPET
jgi:hypothetical protein